MDFMCKINMRKVVKIAHNAMVSWDNYGTIILKSSKKRKLIKIKIHITTI